MKIKSFVSVKKEPGGLYVLFDTKYSILNQNHKHTERLVRDLDLRNLHSNAKQTLMDIRQKFWIPRGQRFVRGLLKHCQTY